MGRLGLIMVCVAATLPAACGRKSLSGMDGGPGGGMAAGSGGLSGSAGAGGGGPGGDGTTGGSGGDGATGGSGGGTAGSGQGGTGGPTSAPCSSYEASAPVARPDPAGRLVWTGSDYVALSAVNEQPAHTQAYWFQIRWTRLDRTGIVLAEKTAYRASGFDGGGYPLDFGIAAAKAIAPSDDGFGALWYEDKTKRLLFARLDADGAAVGGAPVVLGPGGGWSDPAALAWNGSTFGAAWVVASARALRFTTLDRTGTLVGSGELGNVNTAVTLLYLFGQRDDFLVMFEPILPNLDEVRGARFDLAGQPVGGAEAALLSDPTVYAGNLVVDRLEAEYAVTWSERPKVGNGDAHLLRRLDATGTVVAGPFPLDDAAVPLAGLAHNDHELGAIVADNDALAFQSLTRDGALHGARIEIAPRAPTVGGATPVPGLHAITWDGDGFGVLWTGSAPAGWGTYYTFLRCVR